MLDPLIYPRVTPSLANKEPKIQKHPFIPKLIKSTKPKQYKRKHIWLIDISGSETEGSIVPITERSGSETRMSSSEEKLGIKLYDTSSDDELPNIPSKKKMLSLEGKEEVGRKKKVLLSLAKRMKIHRERLYRSNEKKH